VPVSEGQITKRREILIVRVAARIFTIFAIVFFFVACSSSDEGEGGSSGDPEECVVDSDCTDDGQFCNGVEICVDSSCVGTGDPCSGATPICDEATDACEGTPT